jgi:uncharacterized membrane protein
MSKFVVVVLPDEKKAFEALRSIKELHAEGIVTVYDAAVAARKSDGSLEIKQGPEEGPLGLGVGALLGGLVGLFGGPAGAAAGVAVGGLLGSWRDYMHAGVGEEFLETIARDMPPGNFAVIAEVSEDWVTPIDSKMEALGGRVVREYRDEVVDDMIEKRADSVRSELDRRKTEHAGAKAQKMEAKLEKRIDEVRQDLQETASKARKRLDEKQQEMNAKIAALQEQAGKAKPEVKSRIDQRIAEIRNELQAREQKLNHAFELAQEALNP